MTTELLHAHLDAPKELDPRGSILFLGSGFSRSAKNILGSSLPTGQELYDKFAGLLRIDSDAYDLKNLADEIDSRPDLSLYQTLYSLFTVRDLHDDQTRILALDWHRIYTTNYDDAVEVAYHNTDRKAHSYSYDTPRPRRLPVGSIIHLHGMIRRMTEETVLQQLVLNEASYIRRHFETSPWYDEFTRDLRYCTACYFIGYSLRDYHISALLMKNPHTTEKTFFITEPAPDDLFCNRVRPYGHLLPIAIAGFSHLCRTLPVVESINSPHSIKSMRYLDPIKNRTALSRPTALEVLNLVTYGSFNYQRCIDTLPTAEYVVPRQKLARDAAERLKDARCLLVHSRIGNGKTIFLYILAHMLSQQGYRCFFSDVGASVRFQDVEILKTIGKSVIFFDSYNSAIDIVGSLTDLPAETRFVVAVRTSVQDVRLHEIYSKLPSPLDRLDLNSIDHDDVTCFTDLLKSAGAGTYNLQNIIRGSRDFRDVIVSLYKNVSIKKKIQTEFAPLLRDGEFRKAFIVSHLLTWIGQHSDAAFIRSVTDCDAYAAIAKHRETAGDIFALDDGELQVRSAIFSEYLIQTHLTAEDIIECVYLVLIEAVKRRGIDRRYQAILGRLMTVGVLRDALRDDPDRIRSIKVLFERLRRDVDINQWPLFWLQYSILMTDDGDLSAAEAFIRTAYARAEESKGFHTFQIDTYATKLFLLIEQSKRGTGTVERFDEIMEKLAGMRQIIADESRRFHAIQVLGGIEPFVSSRIKEFSRGEKLALVQHLNLLDRELREFSREDRALVRSEPIRVSVRRALQVILEFDAR